MKTLTIAIVAVCAAAVGWITYAMYNDHAYRKCVTDEMYKFQQGKSKFRDRDAIEAHCRE